MTRLDGARRSQISDKDARYSGAFNRRNQRNLRINVLLFWLDRAADRNGTQPIMLADETIRQHR